MRKYRNKQTNVGYIIGISTDDKRIKNFYHVPFNIGEPGAETFYRNFKQKGYKRIPESIGDLRALELILGSRTSALQAYADKYRGVKHPMNMV